MILVSPSDYNKARLLIDNVDFPSRKSLLLRVFILTGLSIFVIGMLINLFYSFFC